MSDDISEDCRLAEWMAGWPHLALMPLSDRIAFADKFKERLIDLGWTPPEKTD